ncbi:MAG: hypothetical protein JWO86_6881 [Myxococcaceae bacterium]|nr:hypothetical protein [Myxococcaceae bacterium]
MSTRSLRSNDTLFAFVLSLVAIGATVFTVAACQGTAADALTKEADPTTGAGSEANLPGRVSGSDGGPTVTSAATGLPCDVDAVLKTHCQTCHASQPQFGASTSLVTWDDLQKPGPGANANKKVYELLQGRIHDDARPMPPSPQPRLAAKDASAIDAWIAGGAKSSGATCTSAAAPDGVQPLSCTPDTVLKATKPFTMLPGTPLDQYTCFGVDINLQTKRHITALAPMVDNKQIVHHILLFQTTTAVSTEPFACAAFGSAAWQLVAGWAPGGQNLELPPAAGFPENVGTTHWVVQVHYNNAKAQTGTDQSGYQLCTTETLRPNDAAVLAFGSTAFSIPPRSTTTVRCDYALGLQFANVKLFNASPHMHTRGVALSTERLPLGGGTPDMILDQKAFSFEAQGNFPITKSVGPGDVMRTRCTWKNPGDTPIAFGEGTSDEMCFDFVGYYPAINLPLFTWITPSATALCSVE